MPDAARIAQATVAEIPVTIQGSRIAEGSGQREPFFETTKTTLTFDDGAVLDLKSRVVAGQTVFLRNDQSGKEIQCKVIEAPAEGQLGYTDLEFTAPEPEFWGGPAEEPADGGYVSGAHEAIEAPHESLALAAVSNTRFEEPASEEIPVAILETPAPQLSSPLSPSSSGAPLPETTEAILEPEDGAEPHDAKAAEQLAAMMAKEARRFFRRAFPAKEAKQAEQEKAPEATQKQGKQEIKAEAAPKQAETSSGAASGPKAFSPLALRIRGMLSFTEKISPTAAGIAAAVLIAAALGFTWHAKLGSLIHGRHRTSASSGASSQQKDQRANQQQANQQPMPIPSQPPQTPTSADNAIAKTPATTTADAGGAGNGKPIEGSPASVVPKVPKAEASRGVRSADKASAKASPGVSKHQKPNELSAHETTPPKIVSQPQPSFPEWAKNLDVDGVVKLDALIDEKGNVTETKPLSGPRVLQHAAEGAVGLWIFEPALSNGKPTATHMVLTVEFQR